MSKQLSRLIFTDGAAPNNQNGCKHGGLGVAVLSDQGEVLETYKARVEPAQGQDTTTNVRCEMLAVIKALELAEPYDIIHTDSDMIAKGYNEWLEGWKLKGWKNANKKPVANQDLWQRIDKLKQEKPCVVVKWVRGHSGIYGNELADNLATEAAA
ncbi:ribonuclease HI [Kangiella japonica]|uniref:ribonuclease H n=1 Tax=Kangiella japonica TaxID=647384 RepID=A0ABN0T1V6_9GAMM